MTALHLPRRVLVGVTSGALLCGAVSVVPLLGSASAAACPAWTDPKGDSITGFQGQKDPTGTLTDANLDIVASTFGTVGDSLVATIQTDGLIGSSSDVGDEFGLRFTVAGVNLFLYADRTRIFDQAIPPFEDVGVSNGSDFSADGTATYDTAKKTVTITVKVASAATIAGKAVAGQTATALEAYTMDQVALQPVFDYDASTTTQTAVVGVACGGAAPAPTGSATPGPSATPTASPGPSATATPAPTSSPSPTKAPDGTLLLPRKNCVQFTDGTGDADPTGTSLLNEGSLDITQGNLKSPAGQLLTYVKVAAASEALAPIWDGRVYESAFTVNAKRVVLQASADGPASATVGGAANTDIKATAKIDTAGNTVVFTIPLDGLNKAAATTVKAGTAITDPAAATYAQSALGDQAADSAGTTPAQKTYTYGDNSCFLPPPGKFTLATDKSGQYGDVTTFFATLNDVDDTPVSGARLTAAITGGRAIAAVTDNDGTATFRLPLAVPAGTKTITVTFAGNGEISRTVATKAFVVVVEKTAIRLKSITRGLQATLVDDDRPAHAVVGRYVVFTVGSKKYTVRTNSLGIAKLTGVKKGTAVKVSFVGVKNLYAPAKTVTGRAG